MSYLFPKDLKDRLEFDKILLDLEDRCIGTPARQAIQNLPVLVNPEAIRTALDQTDSYLRMQESERGIPGLYYDSITHIFKWLRVEGSVLSAEDLLLVRDQLQCIAHWFGFFNLDRRVEYRTVYEVLSQTEVINDALEGLQKVFDEEGNVKDSASPELKSIRQEIHSKRRALDHAFNKALMAYKGKGFLAENLESYRNGRRVLAVLAESKRKIPGIILDESSTGRTVFIEPQEAIQLDNQIFELKNEEKREIRKILQQLTTILRANQESLKSHEPVLIQLDLLRAKASQAKVLGANKPKISADPELDLQNARHPLLLMKHRGEREKVIPFSLKLGHSQRIIVISGPNAGGKTITLKTVGLMSLMCQTGLLVPTDSDSVIGVFKKFIADIGDQQSIEQDLSTYTSHLQNMRMLTEKAGQNTLFLVDELGSGTEPLIGGAIAESILQTLHQKQARGIVTTHYGNLKILASRTKSMVNASMAFDKEALKPSFHLRVGTPGSSFAFEMARRSGMREEIIKRARQKIGKKEGQLDHLLTSLQKDKSELEKKLDTVLQREKDLEKLIRNYDQLQRAMDIKRKKLKMEEKAFRLQEQSRANKKIEKVIREIREKEKLEDAKALAARIKKEKVQLTNQVSALHEEIIESTPSSSKGDKPFEVGDHVRMKLGGMTGTIERIQKKKATLVVGNMKMDARLADLEHSRAPIETQSSTSINTHLRSLEDVHRKLDIRGLRREEAIQRLEKFIDKAMVAGLPSVEIIHGKGNGTLKSMVHQKLTEYASGIDYFHPEPQQGGDGVTIAQLN